MYYFLVLPLILLLLVLSQPAISARTEPTPAPFTPLPKPLIIDLTRQLPKEQSFYLDKTSSNEEISVEVRGDGKQWSFIKFEKLPIGLSVKVKDDAKGYKKDQQLQSSRWYPVRDHLRLQIYLDKNATSSSVLWIRTGVLDNSLRGEVTGYNSEDVQTYVNDQARPSPISEFEPSSYSITFYYGEIDNPNRDSSQLPTASASASSQKNSPVTQSRSITTYWAYILPAFLVVLGVIALVVQRVKGRGGKGASDAEQNIVRRGPDGTLTSTPPPGWGSLLLGGLLGGGGNKTTTPAKMKTGNPQPTPQSPGAQSTVSQTSTAAATAAPPVETTPTDSGPVPAGNQGVLGEMATEFADVRDDIKELWKAIDRKQERDGAKIYELVKESVKDEIERSVRGLREELRAHDGNFEKKLGDFARTLREEFSAGDSEVKNRIQPAIQSQLGPVIEEQARLKGSLLAEYDELQRIGARLDAMGQASAAKAEELYMGKLLGFVLENRVDVLRQENFDALMSQLEGRLNKFFSEEVGRDGRGGLGELHERAEALRAAFREVLGKLSELKAEGEGDARRLGERVEGVAAEMIGLSDQLKDRQLDIKTTVHVPVSAHARARRTFLEELGLAIQQEVAKLSDPLVHFEGELERLATSEVIGLADICDRRYPPGENAELEGRLKKLFELARLEDIVPRVGDNFETGKQELLGMIDGQPQQSLKVAQIESRGFVLRQQGGEPALLRKAGVRVYR